MEWWEAVLVGLLAALLLLAAAALVLWRTASVRTRRLAGRLQALSWRGRLRLAMALASDRRVPAAVRLLPALLVIYLALPLDIVPDFVPVLGQLDDVLVVIVGAGLMLRFTPVSVIEAHLAELEAAEAARI